MATPGPKAELMTVATLADLPAVRCAAETPSTEARVSMAVVVVPMAEVDSTAEVTAKRQFC
jgi:hypothetical protein